MTGLVIRLIKLEPPFVLTIDRTEWQLGKRWVNVLMLAIVSESGVAVPLLWTVFSKKGCSNDAERQEILEKYLSILPARSISFVTADREACQPRVVTVFEPEANWILFANQSQYHDYGQTRETNGGTAIVVVRWSRKSGQKTVSFSSIF